jgi:hypothetical protein
MAMLTTSKIRLTKRGVLQNDKIVAPAIRLFARGQHISDSGYIARFRFREMNGADKSVYVEWALLLRKESAN